MVANIKELIASKKFKVAVFSILGLVCAALAGTITTTQAVESAVGVAMVYIGAQGLADFGKSAKQVETKVPTEDKPASGN